MFLIKFFEWRRRQAQWREAAMSTFLAFFVVCRAASHFSWKTYFSNLKESICERFYQNATIAAELKLEYSNSFILHKIPTRPTRVEFDKSALSAHVIGVACHHEITFSTERTIESRRPLFTAHNRHTMTSATLNSKERWFPLIRKKEKSRRECFMIRRQFNWIRSAAWRCRLLIVAFGKRYCHAKVDTRKLKATWKNVMKWFMDSWFQFSLSLRCALSPVCHIQFTTSEMKLY